MNTKKKNNTQMKKTKSFQANNSFDLWNFGRETHFENCKGEEQEMNKIEAYSKYKPQLSIPNQFKKKKKNSISIVKQPIINTHMNKIQNNKQHSMTKRLNSNRSLDNSDYHPDNMAVYIRNKCLKQTNNLPTHNINKQKSKKSNKEIEAIGTNLYKKKIFSNDYETQKKIKQLADENISKQEMSQCTFKPKLYTSRLYKKTNNTKGNIYEQQSKWLESINSKYNSSI